MKWIDDFDCYALGSTIAGVLYFPIWRSGVVSLQLANEGEIIVNTFRSSLDAAFRSPIKGVFPTLFGMSWSRATIFYMSQQGRQLLHDENYASPVLDTIFSTAIVGTFVQIINAPLIMSTIALQNPRVNGNSVVQIMYDACRAEGFKSLFQQAFAGVVRTVPKYTATLALNTYIEEHFPLSSALDLCGFQTDGDTLPFSRVMYSLGKSVVCGVLPSVMLNSVDGLFFQKFVHDVTFSETIKTQGRKLLWRGLSGSLLHVAFPMTTAMFATDMMRYWKYDS